MNHYIKIIDIKYHRNNIYKAIKFCKCTLKQYSHPNHTRLLHKNCIKCNKYVEVVNIKTNVKINICSKQNKLIKWKIPTEIDIIKYLLV